MDLKFQCITMASLQVALKLKRIQYGTLVTMHKDQPGQCVGIELDGNEVSVFYGSITCYVC